MPYTTTVLPSAERQIASWGLSLFVRTEVVYRLRQVLPQSPAQHLRRLRTPFDGMVYTFSMIDPENRLTEHHFYFHVVYGQDEERLFVAHAGHVRLSGV